eukprot:CAMPEP_0177488978 /NCGR_PEP_ID=MMETSP0369-20130122/30451_1 /TAXON_ID=447022 ORGANISM="Scrippsiella hangoei-like, Strain SHHI-4" /NCGR_SAMPLE_ID=MMETSP0369 /ASSEMBLY_ACC=CAM_ASM_000364 /LENGTH=110 /DNA_ID=CAMNT_0018965397 /DNA_START=371 /DNA_END=703 /DNA_ORIENTATION=+
MVHAIGHLGGVEVRLPEQVVGCEVRRIQAGDLPVPLWPLARSALADHLRAALGRKLVVEKILSQVHEHPGEGHCLRGSDVESALHVMDTVVLQAKIFGDGLQPCLCVRFA